ncbi:hypothetical protein LSAT2_025503 [Lamellibrachia satsuma]|nr:hypothetical protein LSAT2_025503 [Lamellibrachia satsuma]
MQAKKPRHSPGFVIRPCWPRDVILLCAESGSRMTSSAAGSNQLYYYLLWVGQTMIRRQRQRQRQRLHRLQV